MIPWPAFVIAIAVVGAVCWLCGRLSGIATTVGRQARSLHRAAERLRDANPVKELETPSVEDAPGPRNPVEVDGAIEHLIQRAHDVPEARP